VLGKHAGTCLPTASTLQTAGYTVRSVIPAPTGRVVLPGCSIPTKIAGWFSFCQTVLAENGTSEAHTALAGIKVSTGCFAGGTVNAGYFFMLQRILLKCLIQACLQAGYALAFALDRTIRAEAFTYIVEYEGDLTDNLLCHFHISLIKKCVLF
jgi:hypothetical protein